MQVLGLMAGGAPVAVDAARTVGVASARDGGMVVRTPRDIQVTCAKWKAATKVRTAD